MDIKLIVSDIDGTLVMNNGSASPVTGEAVRACRAAGTEFVIASGRWYPAALKVVRDQLGLEDGMMIVCNGGAVVKTDGTILMEDTMSPAQARAVYDILHGEKVLMTSYVRGAIYRMNAKYLTMFNLPEISEFLYGGSYEVIDDDEQGFIRRGLSNPYKMEAHCDDFELLARLRVKLEAAGLQVNSSFPFNLEIMGPGAGKGAAVEWLAKYLGLERDQVMAFGDYTNDLPMFESVGWPVAMGNALDEVKAAARLIAPSCAENGVAQMIHKYILGDDPA